MQPATTPLHPSPLTTTRPALLMLGLVLVALNLRPALSSVSPVLAQVQQALGLSATAAAFGMRSKRLCGGRSWGAGVPMGPRCWQWPGRPAGRPAAASSRVVRR
jgi:hypothetical protein